MEGAHSCSVGYGSSKFGKFFAEELDPSRIGYAAILFVVRCVEIAASTLSDFDNRMVVLPRDPGHEVIDPARPYFQS